MMRNQWLGSAICACLTGLLLIGCNKVEQTNGKTAVVPPPPPPVEQPILPPEPANPEPSGEAWVFTPRLTNYIGQALEVRYKLPKANSAAWIAMVPAEFQEKDAPANLEATRAVFELVPAAEAAINLPLKETGQFRLRLFDGRAAEARLLGETPPVTVTQWPLGDRETQQPPYVTIGPPRDATFPVEVQQGFPIIAYYEVPAYPAEAWIGVIPTRVVSPVSSDNDGADIAFGKLQGTKSQFTWMSDRQGTFVFRIFPTDAPGADYVAESEPFTIIPAQK